MMPNVTTFDMLDFPKKFQVELLRHLIASEDFYQQVAHVLKVTDFDFPPCQIIFDALNSYYKAYRTKPQMVSLEMAVFAFAETGGAESAPIRLEERPAFDAVWQGLRASMDTPLDVPYFRHNIVSFLKRVRWNAILRDMQGANPSAIEHSLQQANQLSQLEVSTGMADQFTDPFRDHVPILDGKVIRIQTNLKILNRALGGGLGIGELGMIMACPGVGKTNTILNFACAAPMAQSVRSLVFTCELSKQRIEQRYQAIAAHIFAESLRKPIQEWSTEELARWNHMRTHSMPDAMCVIDFSKMEYTKLATFSQTIKAWKQTMYDRYGKDEAQPLLVCVDWLHPQYMALNHQSKELKTYEIMANLAKGLGTMARDNSVALWSACQGNRSADGKTVLTQRDTAGSFDINQALDVGVGVAQIVDLTKKATTSVVESEDEEGEIQAALQVGNDGRKLSFASVKTRDNLPFEFECYQGPTLKLWDTRTKWEKVLGNLTVNAGLGQLDMDLRRCT